MKSSFVHRSRRVLLTGLGFAAVALLASEPVPDGLKVASPDGTIAVELSTDGALSYRVLVDGVEALGASRLGLRLRDGELGREVAVVSSTGHAEDTTWTNPFGKQREVRDRHNELTLTLRERA